MSAPSPLRVAFGGRMQVGKTTAADWLVESHGFRKYALAAPIKDIASRDFGWDGDKDARGRRLLQEIGTVGRHYEPDLWLDRFAARLAEDDPARAVVDDLRLPREVEVLERLGFTCVIVDRPAHLVPTAFEPLDTASHETEVDLEEAEVEIHVDNGGTFADLHEHLDALVLALEAMRAPR